MGALRLHISYVIVFIIPTGGYLRLWSIKPTLRMLHHEFGGQGTSVNKKRVRRGLHMHPSPRSSVHAHTVGFLVFLVYTTPSFALPHTATVHHDFTSASPIPWSPMPLVSLLGRTSLHLLMDSTCFAPTWVNPVDTYGVIDVVTTSPTSTVEFEKWLPVSIRYCRILTTGNVGLGCGSSSLASAIAFILAPNPVLDVYC